MPWIMQMGAFALMLLGLGLAIWVSFWLLLFIFSAALLMVSWGYIKAWLLEKGILNPEPGVPSSQEGEIIHSETSTVIETDYKRVDSE